MKTGLTAIFSVCREELKEQLDIASKEKKKLRKKLKKFEDDFLEENGRCVLIRYSISAKHSLVLD